MSARNADITIPRTRTKYAPVMQEVSRVCSRCGREVKRSSRQWHGGISVLEQPTYIGHEPCGCEWFRGMTVPSNNGDSDG